MGFDEGFRREFPEYEAILGSKWLGAWKVPAVFWANVCRTYHDADRMAAIKDAELVLQGGGDGGLKASEILRRKMKGAHMRAGGSLRDWGKLSVEDRQALVGRGKGRGWGSDEVRRMYERGKIDV